MNGFPGSGKIVVASPNLAVRLHDKAPEHTKNRIYTMRGMKARQVFVIDIDVFNEVTNVTGRPSLEEVRNDLWGIGS